MPKKAWVDTAVAANWDADAAIAPENVVPVAAVPTNANPCADAVLDPVNSSLPDTELLNDDATAESDPETSS